MYCNLSELIHINILVSSPKVFQSLFSLEPYVTQIKTLCLKRLLDERPLICWITILWSTVELPAINLTMFPALVVGVSHHSSIFVDLMLVSFFIPLIHLYISP